MSLSAAAISEEALGSFGLLEGATSGKTPPKREITAQTDRNVAPEPR